MPRPSRLVLATAALVALAVVSPVDARSHIDRHVDATGLRVAHAKPTNVAPALLHAKGRVDVIVRLQAPSLAQAVSGKGAGGAKRISSNIEQRAYVRGLDLRQRQLSGSISRLGGKTFANFTKALNGMAVNIAASRIPALARLPGVVSVKPVVNYQLDLAETVPLIGAAAAQAHGFTGTGIRVAVLDTGIDYTHASLGGPGTLTAYTDAYGTSTGDSKNTTRDGLFPTAKVVDGYDFVGEDWDGSNSSPPLAEDDDPIDCSPTVIGCDGGHGTHVADIIAGVGTHPGVAPGASLLAVKVCSSVSTACSGVALLEGMEFALDPNGDSSLADHVDVVNMSLGQAYGQFEDDLSAASADAVAAGVVVVASAGNNADRPYILGSPSSTPEVISVAQTTVPSDKLFLLKTPAPPSLAPSVVAVPQPWSPTPTLVSGPLQYGNGGGGNLNGCAAFGAGTLTGKIVLVDRGSCNVSIKVANGSAGGALAVVIANNADQGPGDTPPIFAYGGGTITVTGYTIRRDDGLTLKGSALGQIATIDPSSAVPFVENMVASSSRGPSYSYNAIKPDIGAPGASVSAEAGTGTADHDTAFGGTSGAAPMVSGSVALMLQAHPGRRPAEIKAALMNTGETDIGINPVSLPGYLAPITRIGGGEVRVDDAIDTDTAAWDKDTGAGSLSFGYQPEIGHGVDVISRTLVIHNYGNKTRLYDIDPKFRYPDDKASHAVDIVTQPFVLVPGHSERSIKVLVFIKPEKLPDWNLNGGELGGSGYLLQGDEFDGYINIRSIGWRFHHHGDKDNIHVAWQVLPHKSADVKPSSTNVVLGGGGTAPLKLKNLNGATAGDVDVFALTGTSPALPPTAFPGPGDNFATIDLRAVGVRQADCGESQPCLQFGINTYDLRTHPNYPAEFDIYLNTDGLPGDDYVLFNVENGGFGATGQTIVYTYSLTGGGVVDAFYMDADLNSGNAILTGSMEAMGMTPPYKFDATVYAFDNYFVSGPPTDAVGPMTYTADTPRYDASGVQSAVVPVNFTGTTLTVHAVPGGAAASPSQTGLLLMYRNARPGHEADAIGVSP